MTLKGLRLSYYQIVSIERYLKEEIGIDKFKRQDVIFELWHPYDNTALVTLQYRTEEYRYVCSFFPKGGYDARKYKLEVTEVEVTPTDDNDERN